MRRSSRSNASLRPSAASALADLANRKASGKTRTTDYELEQAGPIYETVDDATYATIAAQKRKEARDFIAAPDDDNPEDEGAAMELEFEMEDELSVVAPDRAHKRKRTLAIRTNNRSSAPTKRVASSFFNSFHAAAPKDNVVKESVEGAQHVFDVGMLDADFKHNMSASRAARRKRKLAAQRFIGDMLFENPPEPLQPIPQQLLEPQSPIELKPAEYAAPPPSLKDLKPDSDARSHDSGNSDPLPPALPPPSDPSLEDSLDTDALVAATEAAITRHKAIENKPPSPSTPLPIACQPRLHNVSNISANIGQSIPPNAVPARDNAGNVIMYLTDAHDLRVNGGQHLYLFGKIPLNHVNSGLYTSACVHVEGMDRVLHVLPRKTRLGDNGVLSSQPVNILPDVHSEIVSTLLGKSHQPNGKLGGNRIASNLPSSVKAKKVTRCCPFGDSLAPRGATEYLKVKFPFSNVCRLQPESSGSTFSRVYGTRTSVSEMFCLKQKLKGPCWVTLSNAKSGEMNVSHAKKYFSVQSPSDVCISAELANADGPPMSALCVSVKTMLSEKTGSHEIIMLSGVYVSNVPINGPLHDSALLPGGPNGTRDFVLVRPPDGKAAPFGFTDYARSALAICGSVEVVPNEQALLNNFLAKLVRYDPDVLIGHDIFGFQLDVLLSRMSARRSREWSRLGRLIQRRNLSEIVKNASSARWFKPEAVAGRLVVDTYMHAKDLLPREKDYTLSSLSRNILAKSNASNTMVLSDSTDVSFVPSTFKSSDLLCKLVSECLLEARTSGRLAAHLSILPLSRQLTCISGNLWSHTLRGARAERIDFLLCHEFKLIGSRSAGSFGKAGDVEAKLLIPDKLNKSDRAKIADTISREQKSRAIPTQVPGDHGYGGGKKEENEIVPGKEAKSKSSRRKPQYSGGLVLEPRKGFYDRYVLQLDFNSLYPSIIQEFNICFTTLHLKSQGTPLPSNVKSEDVDSAEPIDEVDGTGETLSLPGSGILEGVLPRVLRRLVEQRRQVKKLLKEERLRAGETLRAQQLETRQLAIKLTANSLYGCLGFEGSRFFARPIAEMVTSQGRDTLQNTVDLARDVFNAQVIYGDTDSLFVYTGLEDIGLVRKLGMELKRDVNRKYKTLEIEIDAIYRKMLLLRKKKYAALKVINPNNPDKVEREVKGLDLVRHDWCDLSHEASEHFLTQIFQGSSNNVDDAVGNVLSYLSDLASKVNNNQTSLSKYVITRALTKRPQDYPDGIALPHVVVANRLIQEQGRQIKPGDYIKYAICVPSENNSSNGNIAARAYHPDEIEAARGKLVIDVKYYLESQVLPPVLRLCEPFESIDASRIAASLGLDTRRYEEAKDYESGGNNLAFGRLSAAQRFHDVEEMFVSCKKCGVAREFTGLIFSPSGKAVKSSGLQCSQCLSPFSIGMLANVVTLTLRKWISKYYTSPFRQGRDYGQRAQLLRDIGLGGNSAMAKRDVSEAWLYKQLRYAHYLMDVEGRWADVCTDTERKMPVSKSDLLTYSELLRVVDGVFDANAYRFIDMSHFLSSLGLSN